MWATVLVGKVVKNIYPLPWTQKYILWIPETGSIYPLSTETAIFTSRLTAVAGLAKALEVGQFVRSTPCPGKDMIHISSRCVAACCSAYGLAGQHKLPQLAPSPAITPLGCVGTDAVVQGFLFRWRFVTRRPVLRWTLRHCLK